MCITVPDLFAASKVCVHSKQLTVHIFFRVRQLLNDFSIVLGFAQFLIFGTLCPRGGRELFFRGAAGGLKFLGWVICGFFEVIGDFFKILIEFDDGIGHQKILEGFIML